MSSNRLEGLSGRGGASRGSGRGGRGGAAGRFTPNIVSRRSKEERDSTAPAPKPEPDPSHGSDKNKSGPKPGGPRFRGRKNEGIRQEAAGPLAAPSLLPDQRKRTSGISGGSSGFAGGSGSSARSNRPASRYPEGAKIKEDPDRLADEVQRIDIADPERREPYFPIRLPQSHQDVEETVPGVAAAAVEEAAEAPVELPQLEPGPFYLFQLPDLGLDTRNFKAPELKSEDEEAMEVDNGSAEFPSGRLGTLRHHASGRISLLIGDVVLELEQGSQGSSIEEVISLERGQAVPVGAIHSKLLAVPHF